MGGVKTPGQYLIGFCAETDNLEENARGKLARKKCDAIIANPIGRSDTGFASVSNEALALDAEGRQETWGNIPKTEMAMKIWDFSIRS
ncbi:Phosphopantothenoylcysteine decarboxylase [Desulfovibrio sp. DV]|nr:Phosphopantothenoylcysteine decarboxylase [Desulfovibrio sp. DV]